MQFSSLLQNWLVPKEFFTAYKQGYYVSNFFKKGGLLGPKAQKSGC